MWHVACIRHPTPLRSTKKKVVRAKKDATEEQLHGREAARRLLLRVEAVRAVSWLWHINAPFARRVERDGTGKTETASSPLRGMLPILRRRARRHGLVLAPVFRLVMMR